MELQPCRQPKRSADPAVMPQHNRKWTQHEEAALRQGIARWACDLGETGAVPALSGSRGASVLHVGGAVVAAPGSSRKMHAPGRRCMSPRPPGNPFARLKDSVMHHEVQLSSHSGRHRPAHGRRGSDEATCASQAPLTSYETSAVQAWRGPVAPHQARPPAEVGAREA